LRIAALILDRQARTVKPLELKIGIISYSTITAQYMCVRCEVIAVYIHLLLYCRYIFLGDGGEGVEWNFVCLFVYLFKLFVMAYVTEVFFSFRKSGSQPLLVNPSKTAAKKKKKQKEPKGAAAM
jgi:hypothetical protein